MYWAQPLQTTVSSPMREETKQFETVLSAITTRLEEVGGMPLHDAVLHMHAIKRFIASCIAAGCEDELQLAMERAGVGDVTEALLPVIGG
jgi:hypothetical protein